MKNYKTHIRVRYIETDAMGHVHHASYLAWLELGRVEMMDAWGLPYKKLESEGLLMPVLNITIDYKQPSFFDERLTVITFLPEEIKGVRLRLFYEIKRDEVLLAKASSLHTFMTPEGKAIKPPQMFMTAYQNQAKSLTPY